MSSRVDSASSSSPNFHKNKRTKTGSCLLSALFVIAFPVAVVAVIYRLDPFEPVHFPAEELSRKIVTAPASNSRLLEGSERVAEGEVKGPEDLVYDKKRRVIYTGCEDGWIKRVRLDDSVVEKWVNTGGRPLGLALDLEQNELIVGDAVKGLLRVTKEKKIEVLADEAEGLKFSLTDGVDIGEDGTIYFTDASHKYSLNHFYFDVMEGKPHGRFLSYNPSTKKVTLLASKLYFPNGVAVSPDQKFVVFCETVLRRCRKYYLEGPKKGRIGEFSRDFPGMPDNIHYVGQGHYFIAMATSLTREWDLKLRYPWIRKGAAMIAKYVGRVHVEKNGGILVVDLEGKQRAHYYDHGLSLISSGIKIDNHIYCGSLTYPYILRLDVNKYPALPSTSTAS